MFNYHLSIFPYDSVYFKALKRRILRAKDENFHTIPSILKLHRVLDVVDLQSVFPYDSVYFKAPD